MLHQDKRIIFTLIAICLFSCSQNDKKSEYVIKCTQISIQNIEGDRNYRAVYSNINDTLTNWKIHNLVDFRSGSCDYSSNRVDSLMCFNKLKNKMVTAILEKGCNEDYGDGIHILYGAKIKGQWYFFSGAYILLPREIYVSKDIVHEPLSFSKLHEIALEEVFSGYLIKKKKDVGWWNNLFSPEYEYEINEKWFDSHFKTSWGYYKNDKFITPTTQEEWDSLYLEKALSIWKK